MENEIIEKEKHTDITENDHINHSNINIRKFTRLLKPEQNPDKEITNTVKQENTSNMKISRNKTEYAAFTYTQLAQEPDRRFRTVKS